MQRDILMYRVCVTQRVAAAAAAAVANGASSEVARRCDGVSLTA